ncbi:MAG: 4Fe-4S binding protein [Bacteroidales bacterium]
MRQGTKRQAITTGIIAFILTVILLTIVQVKPKTPLLLAERIFQYGGWIQVLLFSFYAGFIGYKMTDRGSRALWRKRIWMLFSIVFFTQLFLGLFADSLFLMSGKLHFPIPALIIAGPVYRMEIGFMPVLLLSTILLSGPAWCSQLCYFGAFDNFAAGLKSRKIKSGLNYKIRLRNSMLILIVLSALILRLLHIGEPYVSVLAVIFGLTGIAFMVLLSSRKGLMTHCAAYCPIGTFVSLSKKISPFRFSLTTDCTKCMACVRHCKYDALNIQSVKEGKIGINCTYCGDCLSACHHNGLEYRFLKLSSAKAEHLWIVITVTLHACFMAIARI